MTDPLLAIIRQEALRGTPAADTLNLLRLLVSQDPGLVQLDEPDRPPGFAEDGPGESD